ncbi:type IV toxin-antitoxin system AbiEi family antitoxin domain-containing protein [Nocardioides turkmenicus]|uniref:type IV toxin-antitoxin system AbiEi family antitoxin domain-containing protein n=1 Tax=Nocardioides turkmenicus TaxID=2711220 RepID=UPI0019CFA8E2|nr:type IV toxin-antitoxin system AbiEi family antitoxin domain-containing protein [Nocardioides sp. KC13]
MSDSEDLQAIHAREDAARLLDAQRRMQGGVATHAQLTAGGFSRIDIERAVRRNELRRVHPRVYIDHTGPLTWEQRAWAAVLYAGPAVLCRGSLEAPRGRDDGRPIHVAIDHSRKVMPQPGIVVHRMRNLELKAYGGTPPRLKAEDNALAMANEARSEIDAIAQVAEVASRSYVTAASLQAALDRAHSLRRRKLIQGLVDDLATGTHSVLEHGYLTKVERPHGLPEGRRQSPRTTASGNQFRDVEYEAYGLVVELDGALGHESWRDQARDADRSLDDLARLGSVTARLRFHQVFGTPCQTAARVGEILIRNGWTGPMRDCGPSCHLRQ